MENTLVTMRAPWHLVGFQRVLFRGGPIIVFKKARSPADILIHLESKREKHVGEAHSFGLYGKNRNGISELVNKLDQVDIYMSSLSKVCGAGGGFIAGPSEVMNWLTSFGRLEYFQEACPPAVRQLALPR